MVGSCIRAEKTISDMTSADAILPPAALPRIPISIQVSRMLNKTVKVAPAALANSRRRAR